MRTECDVQFVRTRIVRGKVVAQFRGVGRSLGDPQCRASLDRAGLDARIALLAAREIDAGEERKALRAMRCEQELQWMREYISSLWARWRVRAMLWTIVAAASIAALL